MACDIKQFEGREFFTILANKIADDVKLAEYITSCYDGVYKDNFVNWCYNNYKTHPASMSEKELADRIVEYNTRIPEVTDSLENTRRQKAIMERGYSDLVAREKGIKHLARLALDIYDAYNMAGVVIKGNAVDFYTTRLKIKWTKEILKRIAILKTKDLTPTQLEEAVANLNADYEEVEKSGASVLMWLEEQLGGNNIGVVEQNFLAVWKELHGSEQAVAEYISEVFSDKSVQYIVNQNKEDFDSLQSKRLANEAAEVNQVNTEDGENVDAEDDADTTILVANSHLGSYSNYMMHLGERLRRYFDTLPKLLSAKKENGEYVYKLDDRFNLQETMTAEEVSSTLYAMNGEFSSYETMITAIRKVARTVKGFEAFAKLADDLENDLDFATELRSVFAKTVMGKIQIRVNSNRVTANSSNNRSNPQAVMLYNIMNDARVSLLNNDESIIKEQIDAFSKKLDGVLTRIARNKNTTTKETLEAEVVRIVKSYFPSLEEAAILSYIEINKNANGELKACIANMRDLLNMIKSFSEQQQAVRTEYSKVEASRRDAAKKLDMHNSEEVHYTQKQVLSLIQQLTNDDFIPDSVNKLFVDLSNMMLPYSVPKLQLNSPNVLGNNSSDVINNSYLTRIKKLLEQTYIDEAGNRRNKALEEWGKQRLEKTSQFKYSNILIEQVDENGVVQNKGIFKYNGDQLVLTDYAEELLQVYLFDGSSMLDEGSNAVYSEMGEGGYLPSAFMSFFKPATLSSRRSFGANYFCRTPSDAPKNFIIRGQHFDITGLFEEYIEKETTDAIEEYIKNLHTNLKDVYKLGVTLPGTQYDESNITAAEISVLEKLLTTGGAILGLDESSYAITDPETNEAVTLVSYKQGNTAVWFVFKGTLTKSKAGKFYIKDAKVVGYHNYIVDSNGTPVQEGSEELPDGFKTYFRNYYNTLLHSNKLELNGKKHKVKYRINKSHPVFRMLKNAFKQEMLDAAVALDKCFVVDETGWVEDSKESTSKTPKLKVGNDEGFDFYHRGKEGILNEEGGLDGSVFHSNKFTLVHQIKKPDGTTTVIVRNYLNDGLIGAGKEELEGNLPFQLLYGQDIEGDENTGSYLHVVRAEPQEGESQGRVIDVKFTKYQDESVDQALTDFILDYVDQSVDKVTAKEEFIHHTPINHETVADFALNYLLFYFSCDDLFEGNTKFYKDSQTILKRAKEIQGSGVPYGIVDYLDVNDTAEPTDIEEGSFLNSGETEIEEEVEEIKDGKKVKKQVTRTGTIEEFIEASFKTNTPGTQNPLSGVKQRTRFRGLTVRNTKMTNETALNALEKKLIDIFVSQGVLKTRAVEKAKTLLWGPIEYDKDGKPKKENGRVVRRGGFTDTKVNDAQSYITFKEWVRRIAARGQLKRYLPLIKKLLDETRPLTAKDLSEFVQVQKNFYYDQHYDEQWGIYVPRQIKNSELVLVPRLIKGTELEKVAEIMERAGIDQLNTVETSKAANGPLMDLWDNEGELTLVDKSVDENGNVVRTINEERVEAFIQESKERAQTYDYAYLYTQQETPQHMNATNKAGIQIVKKMIDNIPNEGHPLSEVKKEYFKLFCQNIKESYTNLMDEFDIPLDANGNIILEQGELALSSKTRKAFARRFREELLRLGVDRNMLDYVTIDENGVPRMPYFLNISLKKLESVAQSMFNSSITRQKLPGFHAAQVTRIGFRNLSKDGVGVSKELKYHPINEKTGEPEGYIEIMLPASALGIDKNSPHYAGKTDKEILEELQNEGLDEIIGYRIPTEGKQSVCVMKIVKFLDDSYGSTIVVPDDWVSQTGSDFDIDSIYGILPEITIGKRGEASKVKYKTNFNKEDWFKGHKRTIDKALERLEHKSQEIREIEKQLAAFKDRKKRKKLRKQVEELEEHITALVPKFKEQVIDPREKKVSKDPRFVELSGDDLHVEFVRDRISEIPRLISIYTKFVDSLRAKGKEERAKQNEEVIELLREYQEVASDYVYTADNSEEDSIEDLLKESGDVKDHIISLYNKAAKELRKRNINIISLEDYIVEANKEENYAQYNSRASRNTRIFEDMVKILKHPSSLEENLSRSNFDKIIEARNRLMSDDIKKARQGRSAYNVFDQIAYQEDATSGLALKGLSVSLDTFCSVCNTVRPRLTKPITIVYPTSAFGSKTEAGRVRKRFGQSANAVGDETFEVKHDRYGWSEDNYNVSGDILTAYSSQTTAHILDAIKEGRVQNVSTYTFSVYKTLVNIGSTYDIAIAFITQPSIERIALNREATNSVFSTSYGNPIHQAIRDIARELPGINADVTTPITAVLASIHKKYGARAAKIFGKGVTLSSLKDSIVEGIPVHGPLLEKRINKEVLCTSPVEGMSEEEKNRIDNLIFDLAQVLVFNRLNNIANQVGAVARCCNPDKFGAKQTVFATNEVIESMKRALKKEDTDEEKSAILVADRLTNNVKETVNILEAIYPGISQAVVDSNDPLQGMRDRRLEDSLYPTLYAYLKYATATSILITRAIFPTQSQAFIQAVKGIRDYLSGGLVTLDEATYNDVQDYIVSTLCTTRDCLSLPIELVQQNDGKYHIRINKQDPNGQEPINYDYSTIERERRRVYGFNHAPTLKIVEENPNIDEFNISAIDTSLVDVEEHLKPWKSDPSKVNKTIRIYLKGQHEKGYFELVHDIDSEPGHFSVHFKTAKKGAKFNSPDTKQSTKEERKILFKQLVNAIPPGAFVSTWGELSPEGVQGLNNVGRDMVEVDRREVHSKETGETISIPIYQKPMHYVLSSFEPENINHPTQEEIAQFNRFSPAQKVQWLKEHLKGTSIFTYLETSLHNPASRGFRQGMQTIEYTDNNISINVIFNLFEQAFYNTNPLIKSAAVDLIKYAFLVEGYKMKGRGITKIISNNPLIDEQDESGLGFVTEITRTFDDLAKPNLGIDMPLIYERYLRSHKNTKGLRTIYLNKKNKDKLSPTYLDYGLIYLSPYSTEDEQVKNWNERMVSLGICHMDDRSDTPRYNSYVRIKDGERNTLYKIVSLNDGVMLYPLDNLEEWESTQWSCKPDNNFYKYSSEFYEALIETYKQGVEDNDLRTAIANAGKAIAFRFDSDGIIYKYEDTNDVNIAAEAADFTLENEEGTAGNTALESLLNLLRGHFTTNNVAPLYFNNLELSNYIFTPGPGFGSKQTITVTNKQNKKTAKSIIIEKVDTSRYERLLSKNRQGIYKVSDADFNKALAEIEDEHLRKIVSDAREMGLSKLDNVYVAFKAKETESAFMSVGPQKAAGRATDFIQTQSKSGDELAAVAAARFRGLNVKMTEDNIARNNEEVHRQIANYAINKAKELKSLCDAFTPDPANPDIKIPITDPRVQQLLMRKATNAEDRRAIEDKYQRVINEAYAFIESFSKYGSINPNEEPLELQRFIKDIQKALEIVTKLPIQQAEHMFNQYYVSSLSTNPLVKSQTIKIMDSFYKTHGGLWRFMDIAENSNPMLQVFMKEVMGDVEAKIQMGRRRKAEFLKEVKRIQREAAAHGMRVDFDKFIDKDGRFILKYTNDFVDKLNELKRARDEAVINYGLGSIEHLKAKLEYDEFRAKHTHQEARQEYYLTKCKFDRIMLEGYDGQLAEIYSKYMKKYFEKLQILTYNGTTELSEEDRKALDRIDKEIHDLMFPEEGTEVWIEGDMPLDVFVEDDETADTTPISTLPLETRRNQGQMLLYYVTAISDLNKKYFKYDSAYGFEEQLKQALDVIRRAEDRDANGIPRKTQAQLEHDDKYQEAKKWVLENAKFVVDVSLDEEGHPMTLGGKIQAALGRLKLSRGGKRNHRTSEMCREKGLYDSHGIPDPTSLTDEDIEILKAAQQANYGMTGVPEGLDKILISNGAVDRNQYSRAFYDNLSLSSGASKSAEYYATVTEINKILEKYVEELPDTRQVVVRLDKVPDTPEGIAELKRLAELYDNLKSLGKAGRSEEDAAEVAAFVRANINTDPTPEAYATMVSQKLNIDNSDKSQEFKQAWADVVFVKDDENEGFYLPTSDGRYKLNRFLFDSFRPTEEALAEHPEWIDLQHQNDINLINQYYRTVPTIYWYRKESQMLEKQARGEITKEEYITWWKANHVWNPYTKRYELLDVWVTKEIKDELFTNREFEGRWEPRGNKRVKKVQDDKVKINGIEYTIPSKDMRDHDFVENGTLEDNYIVGSQKEDGTTYDNNVELNDYEKAMRDLMRTTLDQTATTSQARHYFSSGRLPARAKNVKSLGVRAAKEFGKMFGISIDNTKNEEFYQEISYIDSATPNMPMTDRLESKDLGTQTFDEPAPVLEGTSEEEVEEYNRKLAEWNENRRKVEEKNREVHQQLLDRDWISVMEEYLDRSARHNAVLDNRERLFYLLNFLKNQRVPYRKHSYFGDLQKDKKNDSPNKPVYDTTVDEDLIKQYTTFIRRFMFDQWKADEGWLTNLGKRLQGFTSANYMMLNYRGGVANVTVGEASVLQEAAAREYIDAKDWAFGVGQWVGGSLGFIRGMYDDNSTNLQDAIVKFFRVVDYDEVTGVVTTLDMEKYSKRVRDFMFHPQTVGEHFMQNAVLFAMLHSHKVVTLREDPSGVGVAAMNKEEYIRYREGEELLSILSPEQKARFDAYKKHVCEDLNELKEFAWWRKDMITEFIALYCDKTQRDDFKKKRKENRDKYIREFDSFDNMYDQLDLDEDGYMTFKPDSALALLDSQLTQEGKVTAALELTGRFTERVRKVNNKIHGVYNKIGQAYIEGRWYGSLVMQYHKHIPMGIAKRYRAQGYYNETRGTTEKGMVQTFWDVFLNPYSLNNRMVQMRTKDIFVKDGYWTKDNIKGIQALLFHLTHTFQYLANIGETWSVIPEYERANIRRNIHEAIATLSAICFVIALLAAGDDDDDGIWYNFWLYEADRLSSEVFMYNPIGLYSEGKTLFSTPVAVQSVITDGMNTITNIMSWMLDSEHDMYYHSGQFAGRNRLSVYLERRLPMWNGIRSIRDIPRNNHYYKRGTKVVSLINAKGIAKWLKGED